MQSLPDLARLIPLTARTVLDVGCGHGLLCAAYRQLNPAARLLGFDKDPAMVRDAAPHFDEIATADAETDPIPFDTPDGIDCIVYSAILEHLAEPFAVLRAHAEALAQDGTMLICVSNVSHWSMAERLLRGTFRYEDSGLLDRGHLRWFSIDAMRDGLTEAGLIPIDVQPRVFDEARGKTFVEAMTPALRALGIEPEEYARTAMPLQFVWRVRKKPVQRIVIAGDMLAPVGGVSHLRVIHPLIAMASDPGVTMRFASAADPPRIDAPPDTPRVFVMHRPALTGAAGRRQIDTLIDQGWLVVTEFDDHPDFLRGMTGPDVVSFRGAHAVQTTTPALAAVLRQRNPEMALFPNAIATLPPVRNFTEPAVLTVFFGALNREADWRAIIGPINAVAAKAGRRLRFQVVHDQGFFDALETSHKKFTPLCDYDTYLDLLGRSEISLMPLDDTPFNRAKSDLKFIEAGACRVAALASAVVYENSIVHDETGLIFHDSDEFHRQFLRLTAIPDLALDLGNRARDMVRRDRMLAGQVQPRLEWYRALWGRRDELTRAVRERLDGMALHAG